MAALEGFRLALKGDGFFDVAQSPHESFPQPWIHLEYDGADVRPADGLPLEVNRQFAPGRRHGGSRDCLDLSLPKDNGKQPRLYTVIEKHGAETRGDHRPDATTEQARGGGGLGAADAEIPAGEQNRGIPPGSLVEDEFGIFAAIRQIAIEWKRLLQSLAGCIRRLPGGRLSRPMFMQPSLGRRDIVDQHVMPQKGRRDSGQLHEAVWLQAVHTACRWISLEYTRNCPAIHLPSACREWLLSGIMNAMNERDDLSEIPSMVPDRDHMDTHRGNQRAREQEIAAPGYYRARVERVSTWPVRIMLALLTVAVSGGGYSGWYFYNDLYRINQSQTSLRLGDLELQLNVTGQDAAEEAANLRDGISRTIEQYDLLWANWRANNQKFEDIEGELARLALVNEGQDEAAANNARRIADTNESLSAAQRSVNGINNDLQILRESFAGLEREMGNLAGMQDDLESIREALSSGDSTVLGLVGRLEYVEQSMESVNAHRLQINQTLFNLQEQIESLQTRVGAPGSQ